MEEEIIFKCPFISKETIREKVEDFREKYWNKNIIPIDIEKIIEKGLNLYIEPWRFLRSVCDIEAYLKNDLTGIIVDEELYMDDRNKNRCRFSFAHEIGHLILHKETIKNIGISDPKEWIRFRQEIPEDQYSFFEYQANEFAGRLLVPVEPLKKELDRCLGISSDYDYLLKKEPEMVLDAISNNICKYFGVSSQVINTRLKRENLRPPQ